MMTTIAANLKEMAGDSRVSVDSICYHTDKVFSIGDSIVGVCGDAGLTTKFLAWFRKECPSDEIGMSLDDEHEFAALVLNPRGLFYYSDCAEPDKIHDKNMAIGAGMDIAQAAMFLGKTPTEAVHVACKLDVGHTGGPVKTLALTPTTKSRKSRKAKTALPPIGAQTDAPTIPAKDA